MRKIVPEVLTVHDSLNLDTDHELYIRRVLSQAAVFHFAYQAAICKFNIDAGAGSQVARADEAQTSFRDIQHAAGFAILPCAVGRTYPQREINGVTSVPALWELIHGLMIGSFISNLYLI